MLTLKFGGTSMGSARRILDSTNIMISRSETDRISVVVSAVAGVSNKLQDSIDGCMAGSPAESFVDEVRRIHNDICVEISARLPAFNPQNVMQRLEPLLAEYKRLLEAVSAFGECPDSVHCRIMGSGLWSLFC